MPTRPFHLSGDVRNTDARAICEALVAGGWPAEERNGEVEVEDDLLDFEIYPTYSAGGGRWDFLLGGKAEGEPGDVAAALERLGATFESHAIVFNLEWDDEETGEHRTLKHPDWGKPAAAPARAEGAAAEEEPFPAGERVLGGRIAIEARRWGPGIPGIFRGQDEAGAAYLVTVSGAPAPSSSLAEVKEALVPGGGAVAELAGVDTLAHPRGGELSVLVEREPAGAPVSEGALAPEQVLALGAELAGRLEAHPGPVGPLRPELLYTEGGALTGLAPRAEAFVAATRRGIEDVGPLLFTVLYAPPELQDPGKRTRAGDVFFLSAVLAELLGGRHPFARDSTMKHIAALAGEPPDLDRVDGDVAALLERGLAKAPGDRPSMRALRIGLEQALAAR